jgi:hypothetical protein
MQPGATFHFFVPANKPMKFLENTDRRSAGIINMRYALIDPSGGVAEGTENRR